MTKVLDRRAQRTRRALRDALAQEIHEVGDLSQVTVTNVAMRADVTRRTFYSHYRDIADLVAVIEEETIQDLVPLAHAVSEVTLTELEEALAALRPCPHATEVLAYFRENGELLAALLGEGGDPAFVEKIKQVVRVVVENRAADGFDATMLMGFDYYLTFVISAEVGVLVRWLTTGMHESDDIMACMMTALLFVRPGDLYGRPIDFDIRALADKALTQQGKELLYA